MSGKTFFITLVDLVLVVAIAVAVYLAWGGDGGSDDGEQEARPFGPTTLTESELERFNAMLDDVYNQIQKMESQLLLAAFDLLDWSNAVQEPEAARMELTFICKSVPISVTSPTFSVTQSQVEAGNICRKLPDNEQSVDLDAYRKEISLKIREDDLGTDPGEVFVALSRGLVKWSAAYRVGAAPSEDFVNRICSRVPLSGFGLRSSPPFGEPYASADSALIAICADRREGRASDLTVLAGRIIEELAPVLR